MSWTYRVVKDGACGEDVFVNVVDDYLAHCAKHTVSPNKPMAGHTERHGK